MWHEMVILGVWGGMVLGAGMAFLSASYQVVGYCRENAKWKGRP
jgi:hypothetical protein